MKERLVRERIFFFALVGILAFLTFIMVWPFATAILIGIAAVVILKPVYNWFLTRERLKGSEKTATAASILVFVLVVGIPTVFIIGGAVSQLTDVLNAVQSDTLDESIQTLLSDMEDSARRVVGDDFHVDEVQIEQAIASVVQAGVSWVAGTVINLGASLPAFFTSVIIVLVLVAVLLPRYKQPGKQQMVDLVPLPPEITQLYLEKIDMMITAMFKGTFVIAIVQGLAMGVVLWIAGVPYVSVLTIISIFVSIIPIAGISWVAWPVAILLIVTGHLWQGVFVIAVFLVVVSNIDTILRPRLVPKGAYLNPLLVILSVFGGLKLLGFIGIIYGPVIMILLVTSLDIYSKYMLRSDLEVLLQGGELDLQELGLEPADDQAETEPGEIIAVFRNLANRFRFGPQTQESAPEGQEESAAELGGAEEDTQAATG